MNKWTLTFAVFLLLLVVRASRADRGIQMEGRVFEEAYVIIVSRVSTPEVVPHFTYIVAGLDRESVPVVMNALNYEVGGSGTAPNFNIVIQCIKEYLKRLFNGGK